MNKELLITGIPLIDRQHEEYARLVDQVFEAAERGRTRKKTVLLRTNAVIEYAIEHFDAEEALMLSEKYPKYEEHRAKHNIFRAKTDSFISMLENDIDLDEYMILLSKWLVKWFCDQVQNDDLKLASFIKSKQRST